MSGSTAAQPDNRLAFLDQAMFLGLRATGQDSVMQVVWIYEHPVDLDALRRFHLNFGNGLAGRLIERSPLPFGRHRWVSSVGPATDLDIAEIPRPRAEVGDWADERAQLPVDPEWGPGWHIGVLPLTDGSTAITTVGSHCLGDGGGALLTIFEAVTGNIRDLGYPPPRSRTRLRAMASDARETLRGIPEVARTLVAAAKLGLRRRHEISRSGAPQSAASLGSEGDQLVIEPAVAIHIDIDEWDACAETLGGTSYTLVAGFAAKLAEQLGRVRKDDGAVSLIIPVNDRTLEVSDTRANAVSLAYVTIDPTHVTKDLSGARIAIRQAMQTAREGPDETLQLLPLIPLLPKRAVRRMADLAFGFADLPVSCTNLGDVVPAIGCPDGTAAEGIILRGVDRHITRREIERKRGLLTVVSGRIGGKISISVIAYQPGRENSKSRLHELASDTLAEFGMTGVID